MNQLKLQEIQTWIQIPRFFLRDANPVVLVGGQQFVVLSRHIEQPQRQARKSSEKVRKKMRINGWSALKNILPTTEGVILEKEIILKIILMTPPGAGSCVRRPNELMLNPKLAEEMRL
ncbi:hypothetical protein OUZ56_033004 [Daphnia magna]|uniref:Uncharacterized protein n=1 Tax=Daphnia magna TaxID=35525 RepID=A0ABR0B9Z1_9CRUS|nr:hypothetical protein OUZ56_033004 [Daphnia magna]